MSGPVVDQMMVAVRAMTNPREDVDEFMSLRIKSDSHLGGDCHLVSGAPTGIRIPV
jgi:hypothetical protein